MSPVNATLNKKAGKVVVAKGAGWIAPISPEQRRHSITFDFRLELRNDVPHLDLQYVDRDPPATPGDDDPDGFKITAKEGEPPVVIIENDSSIIFYCPVVRTPTRKKKSQYTELEDLAAIRIQDNGRGKHRVAPDEFEIVFAISVYSSSGIVGGGDIRIISPEALTQGLPASGMSF